LQWEDTLGGAIIIPGSDAVSIGRSSEGLPEKYVEMVNGENTLEVSAVDVKGVEDIAGIPTTPHAPPDTKDWEVGLYFVGCINYFDAFREAHRTSFCYVYRYDHKLKDGQSNGSFAACEHGNDAD
jgi:hypothetical protein